MARLAGHFVWLLFLLLATTIAGVSVHALGNSRAGIMLVVAALIVVGVLIEWIVPFRRELFFPRRFLWTDTVHLGLTFLVVPAVWGAWVFPALARALTPIVTRPSAPVFPMPLVLEAIFAFLLLELGKYWAHRAQHSIPLLWRFHAVHHAVPGLWTTNTATSHPIDSIVRHYLPLVPLAFLGISTPAVALAIAVSLTGGVCSHANIGLRNPRWMSRVFATFEAHRFHHSREPREANCNFGVAILIWDWMFGTLYVLRDRQEPAAYGIDDDTYVATSPLRQLVRPFLTRRWAERLAGKRA